MRGIQPHTLSTNELLRIGFEMNAREHGLPQDWCKELLNRLERVLLDAPDPGRPAYGDGSLAFPRPLR